MRIVSWNCNGKFREKFKKMKDLNADIYVIQECENPQNYIDTAYSDFAKNYIWNGEKRVWGFLQRKTSSLKAMAGIPIA